MQIDHADCLVVPADLVDDAASANVQRAVGIKRPEGGADVVLGRQRAAMHARSQHTVERRVARKRF